MRRETTQQGAHDVRSLSGPRGYSATHYGLRCLQSDASEKCVKEFYVKVKNMQLKLGLQSLTLNPSASNVSI
ncbi:hypothetical protein A6R68_15236 [Neotoma lepida]|uniref:Uncharacterized protein n=1 Tax=Neotoma lepida TaxID=56216 RepID=A0A1A6H6J1_NEOLE|nr:hypothetical protein A6R68_15236 [Neotoma lepida]